MIDVCLPLLALNSLISLNSLITKAISKNHAYTLQMDIEKRLLKLLEKEIDDKDLKQEKRRPPHREFLGKEIDRVMKLPVSKTLHLLTSPKNLATNTKII